MLPELGWLIDPTFHQVKRRLSWACGFPDMISLPLVWGVTGDKDSMAYFNELDELVACWYHQPSNNSWRLKPSSEHRLLAEKMVTVLESKSRRGRGGSTAGVVLVIGRAI